MPTRLAPDDGSHGGSTSRRRDMPGTANCRFTKLFLKPIAINVVTHDVLAPITSGDDMIDRVRILNA
jgi:hypothetical protein